MSFRDLLNSGLKLGNEFIVDEIAAKRNERTKKAEKPVAAQQVAIATPKALKQNVALDERPIPQAQPATNALMKKYMGVPVWALAVGGLGAAWVVVRKVK